MLVTETGPRVLLFFYLAAMMQSFRAWRSRELADPTDWLWLGLVLVCLIPLWIFPFFPTQDGPAHVENADLLVNYWNPARPEVAEFYALNTSSLTNWVGHLALAVLVPISSPLFAEKIFLTAYVLLFSLAARYAVSAISPQVRWIALLTFPLLYSLALYKGFYNFLAGIPIYFFLLGYWLRRCDQIRWRTALILVFLSFLLYLAHVLVWVMGALALGVMALWLLVLDVRRYNRPFLQQAQLRILPVCLVTLIPTILLFAFATRGTGQPMQIDTNWRVSLVILARMNTLVALDERDFWFATALIVGLGALFGYQLFQRFKSRQIELWDGWLVVLAVYFVFYMVIPGSIAGGSFVKQRLVMFLVFALLFWLAAQTYSVWLKSAVAVAVSVWVVSLIFIRLDAQRALSAQVQDLYSVAAHIAPHSTFLPLTLASRAEADPDSTHLSRIRVLLHGAGYVAATRQAIDLTNYEARTDYFPLRYRADRDPSTYITKIATGAPVIGLDAYKRATGVQVDYVLLLVEDATFGKTYEPSPQLLGQLEDYVLVYTSPLAHARLYRHK